MENPNPPVSLAVRLWTKSDFDKNKKRVIRNNIIQLVVGWGLLTIWGLFFEGKFEGKTFLTLIGAAIGLLGLWLGMLQWIYRTFPEVALKNFNNWLKRANKQENWFHQVKCPQCGQTTQVNIGYLQFACQDCGSPLVKRAGFTIKGILGAKNIVSKAPEELIKEDAACPDCSKTIKLQERPAEFICPSCHQLVSLDKIPT